MEQFKITIVIPTFNRGHLLSETINSIIKQSYQLWELIIVDDGSKDDSETIVNNFSRTDSRIIYVQRPSNMPKGANACRNYGLEISTGDYIKWLDSDDLLNVDCLKLQLEEILRSGSCVNICKAQFFKSDNEGNTLLNDFWCDQLVSADFTEDLIFGRIKWQTATGLWEKSIFKKEPFNENLQNSQEWLFNIKHSLNTSLKVSILDESLVYIRTHSGSMSDRSNKNGKYYFHAALARYYALELIKKSNINKKARKFLIKKFLWFQLFTLYKGNPLGFLKLFNFWPAFILQRG